MSGIMIMNLGSAPNPTYSLSRSVTTMNEGAQVTLTLTTTNVPNGTVIPYSISGSGITAGDFGLASLSGNFTVNNNTANVVLTASNDMLTEGTEVFTLALQNGNTANTSVTINDTSIDEIVYVTGNLAGGSNTSVTSNNLQTGDLLVALASCGSTQGQGTQYTPDTPAGFTSLLAMNSYWQGFRCSYKWITSDGNFTWATGANNTLDTYWMVFRNASSIVQYSSNQAAARTWISFATGQNASPGIYVAYGMSAGGSIETTALTSAPTMVWSGGYRTVRRSTTSTTAEFVAQSLSIGSTAYYGKTAVFKILK